jgi:AraC family L-rhamnose operon regulatory protein RhaS
MLTLWVAGGFGMNYCTTGRNFFPGYKVTLCYNAEEAFQPLDEEPCFRIILVEDGTGIVRFGGRRGTFVAPALFCLNEHDQIELEQGVDLKVRSYYFHPSVINSTFIFENIRSLNYPFSETERSDLSWLRSFLVRDENFIGLLNVGPATARRIAGFFDVIAYELEMQRDDFWPCRSRAYFLELLFLIERIRLAPETGHDMILSEQAGEMDPIILYLHTHYQERITIAELTSLFHINRTTLNEKFYGTTGQTIMSYLIGLRMRLASLMLRDTSLPVSEIMDRVGFKDITHFGRTFRKQTGLAPSEYRQKFCWMLKSG